MGGTVCGWVRQWLLLARASVTHGMGIRHRWGILVLMRSGFYIKMAFMALFSGINTDIFRLSLFVVGVGGCAGFAS